MKLLRTTLRLNAASCLIFGALFALAPQVVADFLGAPIATRWLPALGAALIVNGLHLLWVARAAAPHRLAVFYFTLGDLLWWLGTMALLASDTLITRPQGQAAALLVALMVAGFAVLQMWAIGRDDKSLAAIGQAWTRLPLWVRLWLVWLNLVFLIAPLAAPDLTRPILVAYLASAPLLFAQLAHDGGFRRLLGLGHLIPWTPLLIWLLTMPLTPYIGVLALTLAICLAFDLFDLWRFGRGARGLIA